jgi:hypothetical protein
MSANGTSWSLPAAPPAGISQEITDKLHAEVKKALHLKVVRERIDQFD